MTEVTDRRKEVLPIEYRITLNEDLTSESDEATSTSGQNYTAPKFPNHSADIGGTSPGKCRGDQSNSTSGDCKRAASSHSDEVSPKDDEGFYTCSRCQLLFCSRTELEYHVTSHVTCGRSGGAAQRLEPKPFICGLCCAVFTTESDLTKHSVAHETSARENSTPGVTPGAAVGVEAHPPRCEVLFKAEDTDTPFLNVQQECCGTGRVCGTCGDSFTDDSMLQIHQFNTGHASATTRTHVKPREVSCEVCGKIFKCNANLRKHRVIHQEAKPYKCAICDREFRQRAHLRTHNLTHTGEKPYPCTLCGKSFTTSSGMRRHLRIHLDERPHQCQFCDKAFRESTRLKEHMNIHSVYKPFECTSCDKTFSTRHCLHDHQKIHARPHKCPRCDRAFARSTRLKHHLLVHDRMSAQCTRSTHPVETYLQRRLLRLRRGFLRHHPAKRRYKLCCVCRQNFSAKHELLTHMCKCVRKPHHCHKCQRSFHQTNTLQLHSWTHRYTRTHPCTRCARSFVLRSTLARHVLANKELKCEICLKTILKRRLKFHMLIHTGEKPHQCPQCGRAFRQRCNLRIHLLYHSGIKKHVCDHCGKAFTTGNELRVHTKGHTGEKPHRCEICGRGFSKHYRLQSHLMLHSNDRPFRCDLCEKTYTTLSNLNLHRRIHEEGQDHTCHVCNKVFKRIHSLRRHLRRLHSAPS